jgi:hypothetical protein
MKPILPVSSVSQETLAALYAEMFHYSQLVNSQNTHTSVDYNALQVAIKSGSLPEAQAALARLQHDSNIPNSPAAAPSPTSPTADSPADSVSDQDGSIGAQPSNAQSLDATA